MSYEIKVTRALFACFEVVYSHVTCSFPFATDYLPGLELYLFFNTEFGFTSISSEEQIIVNTKHT